jgi:amyloid beta precursor protein binding protein 1
VDISEVGITSSHPESLPTNSSPSNKSTNKLQNPSMTDSFPAALTAPTSKERKYDRQLRLWAASGQAELECSHVLLVNSDGPLDVDNGATAGVIGVETLKNLVLPGIGGFTIVDPAVVTESDLGVNFFLCEDSLGKSRAEETCTYLRELNPDVHGAFYSQVTSSASHILFLSAAD